MLLCLQKDLLNVQWEEKQTETKESVFGTPQMLPISRSVCCITVVALWVVCCRTGCVFLYFLWVYICVYVYGHVFVHTTRCVSDCVCLVEGFIRWQAASPVAMATIAWPSALSW